MRSCRRLRAGLSVLTLTALTMVDSARERMPRINASSTRSTLLFTSSPTFFARSTQLLTKNSRKQSITSSITRIYAAV